MFSLLREGPKILILESKDVSLITSTLIEKSSSTLCDINSAFETSSEESTILFLVNEIKDIVKLKDIKKILTLKVEPEVFLCNLFNSTYKNLITNMRVAPRILLLRAFGNIDKIASEIQKDHGGTIGSFLDILDVTNDSGTVILLSQNSLNKNVILKELYGKCVFIKDDYYHILKQLRSHALKYLNDGIENRNWHELEIKIYDRYSAYPLHYKRLLKVLESLDIGVILGESWGKDHPRFLMSVGIYKIRFFTFHDPKYIKRILLGLEHLKDGMRIVDYDLYSSRKKFYWTDVIENNARERRDLSKKYRNLIFKTLSEEEKKEVLSLEEEILNSRK